MRTATTLLADNYRAQDRKRLIRCLELLDEANRAIDGGMWTGEERREQDVPVAASAPAETSRSSLIAKGASEPLKQAG